MKNIKIMFLGIEICCSICAVAQKADPLIQQMRSLTEENDPAKSTAMMKKIIKQNNLRDEKDGENIDMMKGSVAMDYLGAGKYAEFDKMISSMRNKFNQTSFMSMA